MTPEPRVRLFSRRSSHFSRVAAIFAHELAVPVTIEVVHDLASVDARDYGGHPALKVPTLCVDDSMLVGTENICRRLVELAGRRGDPRVVLTEHLTSDRARSAQELVWQAMANQVVLRVGVAFAKLPADSLLFVKSRASLCGSLTWIDTHLEETLAPLAADRTLSLFEVTLHCLVEHLAFRPTGALPELPAIARFVDAFGQRDAARHTTYLETKPPTSENRR